MLYLRFFVVKTGAGEVESKELGSHHSTIGFEGERRDWLRSSRVSIASGFSPRSAIPEELKLRRSDVKRGPRFGSWRSNRGGL